MDQDPQLKPLADGPALDQGAADETGATQYRDVPVRATNRYGIGSLKGHGRASTLNWLADSAGGQKPRFPGDARTEGAG